MGSNPTGPTIENLWLVPSGAGCLTLLEGLALMFYLASKSTLLGLSRLEDRMAITFFRLRVFCLGLFPGDLGVSGAENGPSRVLQVPLKTTSVPNERHLMRDRVAGFVIGAYSGLVPGQRAVFKGFPDS